MKVTDTVNEIVKKTGGEIREVYLAACGASYADLYASYYFLLGESKNIKVTVFSGREFAVAPPKALGKTSVLLLCSRSGNTPELIEAAQTAKRHGAITIAFTFLPDSKLKAACDYELPYEHGNIINEKPMMILQFVVELLKQIEGFEKYSKMMTAFGQIDAIVEAAREKIRPRAAEFAKIRFQEPIMHVVASGPAYGAAYMEALIVFMQMQWIHSSVVNSGEFLHGPMEAIDDSIPTFLLISEGRTREMDERAARFLKKYCEKAEIIDIRDFGIDQLDSEVQEYFNHAVFNHILAEYNRKLADVRNHPLSFKRYIGKVEY